MHYQARKSLGSPVKTIKHQKQHVIFHAYIWFHPRERVIVFINVATKAKVSITIIQREGPACQGSCHVVL